MWMLCGSSLTRLWRRNDGEIPQATMAAPPDREQQLGRARAVAADAHKIGQEGVKETQVGDAAAHLAADRKDILDIDGSRASDPRMKRVNEILAAPTPATLQEAARLVESVAGDEAA